MTGTNCRKTVNINYGSQPVPVGTGNVILYNIKIKNNPFMYTTHRPKGTTTAKLNQISLRHQQRTRHLEQLEFAG